VRHITKEVNLTEEMIRYEKETGKNAIWRGAVTEKFKKWQRGEEIYGIDKKAIGILVSDEIKAKWEKFADENGFSTISNLIRKSVNFYIDLQQKIPHIEDFSIISHELKRPLTSIKGYAHLLIENHREELSFEALKKVIEILDNSSILENKIITILDNPPVDNDQYDILMVDDDESTINLLRDFFQSRGFKCKETFLGNEAIEFLNTYLPKLILLDILLPDINGFDVCKIIKSNKNLKHIPVYYITAVTEVEVNTKLKETGANGYFLKPFNFSEFNILFDYL